MVKSGDGLTTVILKYHEPPEARKPPAKDPWRLYVFKGEDLLETIQLIRENMFSCCRHLDDEYFLL
ncbi:conserved hypothetical protein [Histoplasma mississippiense (nom. inval.)]|uniref:conserved hypothetical protein n=1 Tax=Ajellomyces capsulatus (strain NAm1 / WU24) TaxID=2059318 RepID=UPI000157B2EC|nr:conserved hypothetical protein [Histoplasma mississippiense (nom. inval.)]EDN02162.1 conserved hypothetical protein [Histoplasma mississippiense (nom. inval.)]